MKKITHHFESKLCIIFSSCSKYTYFVEDNKIEDIARFDGKQIININFGRDDGKICRRDDMYIQD